MKYIWMVIRLILPIAAIILLTLAMREESDNKTMLLCGGLLCLNLSLWLNLWFQRKNRKKQ